MFWKCKTNLYCDYSTITQMHKCCIYSAFTIVLLQRTKFTGGPRRMGPELSGNFRRPLMVSREIISLAGKEAFVL